MYPWARLHQDQIDKLCYKNNLDDVEIDLIEHIKVGFCKSIIDIQIARKCKQKALLAYYC